MTTTREHSGAVQVIRDNRMPTSKAEILERCAVAGTRAPPNKPLFHAVGEADSRYPRPASNHDGSSQGADDDGISWSECVV